MSAITDPDSLLKAACRGRWDLFDEPDRRLKDVVKARREAQAKAICAGCEIQPECLVEALERNDDGVRGGTTEKERRKIKEKK